MMARLLLLLSFLLVAGSAEASRSPGKAQPRGRDGKFWKPTNVAGKARWRGASEVTRGDHLYTVQVSRALRKQIKDQVRAELGLAAGKRITVEDGFFRANPRGSGRLAQNHKVKFDGIDGFSVNLFEYDGKVSVGLDVSVIVKVPKGKTPPRLPQDGRYKGFGLVKGGTYGDVTDYYLRPY